MQAQTTESVRPSEQPTDPENPTPFRFPQITLDLNIHPYLRARKYKTQKHKKTKEGRIKSPHYSKLPEELQQRIINLEPGESIETIGKGKKTHELHGGEKAKVKGIRAAGKANLGLAALDIADTFFENLEKTEDIIEALKSVPMTYVDDITGLVSEVYDAIKDQDYVRLGVISSGVADISTPVTRAVDLIGRHTGVGNVGSETIDSIRESLDVRTYDTDDTPEEFLEKMVDNWNKFGDPVKLTTTLVNVGIDKIKEAFDESGKERIISPRAEHENRSSGDKERQRQNKTQRKGTGKR